VLRLNFFTKNNSRTRLEESLPASGTHFQIAMPAAQDFKIIHDRFEHTKSVQIELEEDLICIPYNLNTKLSIKSQKKSFKFANSNNFLFLPAGSYQIETADQDHVHFFLFLKVAFFQKNIHYKPFASLLRERHAVQLFHVHQAIGAQQLNLIHEITECAYPDHIRLLYIKHKIIELLLLQLVQFEQTRASSKGLNAIEIQRMETAKSIIENNISSTITITSLAREVGTNEQYVKQHFKLLYGKTVFNYLLDLRMEKAKQLLISRSHKIADIAEKTGYRHPSHFSTAFKKYFGYLPTAIRFLLVAPMEVILASEESILLYLI